MKKIFYFIYFGFLIIIFVFRFFQQKNNCPYKNNEILHIKCVVKTIENQQNKRKLKCDNLVIETKNNIVNIGDEIEIFGTINEKVINRFFSEFSLINPEIKVSQKFDKNLIKNGQLNNPVMVLKYHSYQTRQLFLKKYKKDFNKNQSALVSGMVIGAKELFDFDFYEELKQSGLVHIVVASGGNIVILTSILRKILEGRIKRKNIDRFSIVFIVFYIFLVGFEAPIIRAGIMYFLTFWAKGLGRKTSTIYILLQTGLIMLVIDPFLIFSVSFQLSMAATSGIVLFGNEIDELLISKYREGNVIIDFFRLDFSQTLAAQILVMPILLSNFGDFNLLGILANILVAFLVAPISYGGIIYLTLSFIFEPLAQIFSWFMGIILNYFIFVSQFFAKLSFGRIELEFGFWGVLFWYFLVFYLRQKYLVKKEI